MVSNAAAPLRRILARGRPEADPRCAGCAQLGLFRALRRAGLEVQGGSGCGAPDEGTPRSPPAHGRWAAVAGAARAASGAAELLAARAAGARLVAVADRDGPVGRAAAEALARAGAEVMVSGGGDVAAVEVAAREAALRGAVLVVLSPCARDAPRAAALAVDPARCNRCGGCLSLGCPALSDPGGDAMRVDPSICTGCGLCAPLCRSKALG